MGQFRPSGCRIKSILIFTIFSCAGCHHHDWTLKRQHFCFYPVARWASGQPPEPIFGPKISIFLRYAYTAPIFSAQTDPTQWDHKFPISRGNSGYLRFSCMWPFGHLARCFLAPGQNLTIEKFRHGFLTENHFSNNFH